MAVLVFFLALFLSFSGYSSADYCLCKVGGDAALQKTIDYACGAGADCTPILQNGPCFEPNTVKAHCDYAANSYYQNKGQTADSCDFQGVAYKSPNPPSTVGSGCSFPTSAGTSTTGGIPTTSPGGGMGTTPTGGSTTGVPGSSTGIPGSSTGVPGSSTTGIFSPNSMAPAGSYPDPNSASSLLRQYPGYILSLTLTLLFPVLRA